MYIDLFKPEEAPLKLVKTKVPQISRRNEVIAYRYYFYRVHEPKWSYAGILDELSKEFFLEPDTLDRKILYENAELVRQIKEQMPDKAELRKMFPWLVW